MIRLYFIVICLFNLLPVWAEYYTFCPYNSEQGCKYYACGTISSMYTLKEGTNYKIKVNLKNNTSVVFNYFSSLYGMYNQFDENFKILIDDTDHQITMWDFPKYDTVNKYIQYLDEKGEYERSHR